MSRKIEAPGRDEPWAKKMAYVAGSIYAQSEIIPIPNNIEDLAVGVSPNAGGAIVWYTYEDIDDIKKDFKENQGGAPDTKWFQWGDGAAIEDTTRVGWGTVTAIAVQGVTGTGILYVCGRRRTQGV